MTHFAVPFHFQPPMQFSRSDDTLEAYLANILRRYMYIERFNLGSCRYFHIERLNLGICRYMYIENLT